MAELAKETTEVQKQNIGNAGEYYVAALLSAIDYTTTITIGRAEKYDILAVSPEGKPFKLSVKSRLNRNATSFPLSKLDEKGHTDDFFYVFVRLNNFREPPDFWVLPSARVSKVIVDSHKAFLRNGGKDTSMRTLPIEPRGKQLKYFPAGWARDMQSYRNNFNALRR